VFSTKQFLGKITLEQIIKNAQVLLSSIAKRGEMEGIEGKVDCATRIARHKLTVYKNWFTFSQSFIYAN
jgi:uncharacterized pyridoxamine 5'-phosphate oxidase family protein